MTKDNIDPWDEIEKDLETAVPIEGGTQPKTTKKQVNNSTKTVNEGKKYYIPSIDPVPQEKEPMLLLDGVSILTKNNTSAIIAHPGSGKSSVCESICSAVLRNTINVNIDIDTLGFSCGKETTKALFIDCERTDIDVYNSWNRMLKRNLVTGTHPGTENIIFAGLRMIPRLDERIKTIIELIEDHKPDILMIDGAGDLVTEALSEVQATEVRYLFREWCEIYDLSIFTTLHPNPTDLKPRGHIGSEIKREAETIMLIDKVSEDTRIITTDFAHGKSRNAGGVTSGFKWCHDAMMFVSTNDIPTKAKKQEANKVLKPNDYFNILTEVITVRKKTLKGEFHEAIKMMLQGYEGVKVGDKSIRDFIAHLERINIIDVSGTRAKRIVSLNTEKLNQFCNEGLES